MNCHEFGWTSKRGNRVFACLWSPEDESAAKAVIVLVHGMGEHSGRYRHVAEALTAEGYAVYAFDQQGHGRTEGRRGHTDAYEDLLDGIDRLLEEAGRHFPGKPKFLYGHSMGGNVTLNYLLRRKPELAGAVVSSPWLKLAFDPPAIKLSIARMLERIYPKYSDDRPFQAVHLTSDPEMMKEITADPLRHGHISAKFFLVVHRAGRWAFEHAPELPVPLLLMHGTTDTVTSYAASRSFADRAGSLCTFLEWPGFRHELHNEAGRDQVFTEVKAWLKERLD